MSVSIFIFIYLILWVIFVLFAVYLSVWLLFSPFFLIIAIGPGSATAAPTSPSVTGVMLMGNKIAHNITERRIKHIKTHNSIQKHIKHNNRIENNINSI